MKAMLVYVRGFLPVALLLAFTVLLSNHTAKWPNSVSLKATNEADAEGAAFDHPVEAQEFYRRKRAPLGLGPIPVERFLTAAAHIKLMPVHVPGQRSFSPPTQAATAPDSDEVGTTTLGSWTYLGPGNIGGRTRALVIDPASPSIMYAGGVAGGVFKSTSGGASWAPVGLLPNGDLLPNLAVSCLALDSTSPIGSRVLYAGTGESFAPDGVRGAGIYKSSDSGNTWAPLNTSDLFNFYYVNDIVISPNNSQTIYAGTWTGIWRSVDGGATWNREFFRPAGGGCQDLVIRTDRNPDYLLAFCETDIYRSTTGGTQGTSSLVYNEPNMGRTSLAIAPLNQNIVYGLASSSAQDLLAVLKSTDGGSSWTSTVRGPFQASILNTTLLSNTKYPSCDASLAPIHQGRYDNVIAVDPSDLLSNRVFAGGIDLFRSDDGGSNWGLVSYWWAPTSQPNFYHYAHADQHVIAFHPQYNGGSNASMASSSV